MSCCCEKAGSGGWGQFGNPNEEECPSFEAATKQRLGKTQDTLRVIFGVCNSVRLS
jgi:hypothetical protein